MATRSAPVVIQVVLGVLLGVAWLVGRWSDCEPRSAVLVATGVTALGGLVVAAALFTRTSSTARGVGLSTAACAAITLIGAASYALWLL